jgi:hypothetical protein
VRIVSLTERFRVWVTNAKPGEVYVYTTRDVLDSQTPADVQAVASAAREAFARGEIELVQRRRDGQRGPFEYRAIKKREKRIPKTNGVPWLAKVPKPGYCG